MHTPEAPAARDEPSRAGAGAEADEAPLLTCDAGRRVVGSNGAAALLLGRTGAELQGRLVESFSPEDDRRGTAAELAVLMHERPGTWGTIEVVDGETGGRLRLEASCRRRTGRGTFDVGLRRPVRPAGAGPVLSDRERLVLTRVAEGRTGAEVAEELFLSQATVERHVAAGLRKLGAKNRAHGIAIALRTGELERPGPEPDAGWTTGERALDVLLVQTLEGLGDAAAVLDVHGAVLLVNEAWRTLVGTDAPAAAPGGPEGLGMGGRAIGSDDARRADWGIRELLDGRSESFAMEYRCDDHGSPRWFELRATRYHGAIAGAAVFVRHRDLTDQRRAESDARIGRSVLDGVAAATVVYTPEGIITAWMAGAEEIMGWSADEALGRPVWEVFMPRGDRDRGEAIVEEARRNGRWSGELLLERGDGTRFGAEVRVRALAGVDGAVTEILGVAIDISERRRAVRTAAETAARLQAFADTARDGWISGDATGRITQVNASTVEVLGWSAEELVGRPVDAITAAPTPLRPLHRPPGSGRPREVHEECLLAADGREVPIEYTTTRFSTGEGLDQWAVVFRVL